MRKWFFLDLRWESAVLTLSFVTSLNVLMRSIANQLKSDFVVDVIHPIHVTLRNLARLISKRSRHTPFCVDTVWWVDLKKVWPLGKNLGILPWWYLRSQITWRDVFFFFATAAGFKMRQKCFINLKRHLEFKCQHHVSSWPYHSFILISQSSPHTTTKKESSPQPPPSPRGRWQFRCTVPAVAV